MPIFFAKLQYVLSFLYKYCSVQVMTMPDDNTRQRQQINDAASVYNMDRYLCDLKNSCDAKFGTNLALERPKISDRRHLGAHVHCASERY